MKCIFNIYSVNLPFLNSVVNDDKNWLLVLKIVPGGVSWPLNQQQNYSWPEG